MNSPKAVKLLWLVGWAVGDGKDLMFVCYLFRPCPTTDCSVLFIRSFQLEYVVKFHSCNVTCLTRQIQNFVVSVLAVRCTRL